MLERLVRAGVDVPISDTRRAGVAAAALARGAAIINDVSGLGDPAMVDVVAASEGGLVISHLRGEPATMQEDRVRGSLRRGRRGARARVEIAVRAGIDRSRIVVDPGIGGKDAEQSAALTLSAADLEAATGCPVLIGASRKSFLGALTGRPVEERREASVVAALAAAEAGAAVLRVHDVRATVEALRLVAELRAAYTRVRGEARA
ncbi:MAG: dihydropteroate synthase [Nannocystaceae bacterium]